jgi:hypothetical protein
VISPWLLSVDPLPVVSRREPAKAIGRRWKIARGELMALAGAAVFIEAKTSGRCSTSYVGYVALRPPCVVGRWRNPTPVRDGVSRGGRSGEAAVRHGPSRADEIGTGTGH